MTTPRISHGMVHEVGVVLAGLAALKADAGDESAAIDLYRRALASMTRTLGRDHAQVRFAQSNLNRLLATPGDLSPNA